MEEPMSFRPSLYLGSDDVPESCCEPCYQVHDNIKPVAGYCQNCYEDLCFECYTGHLRRRIFRNHKLFDKSTRPKTQIRRSLNLGSDDLPEHYCVPCCKVHDQIKPVAVYCQTCNEDLCLECHKGHLRRKMFRKHKLVDKSTRTMTKLPIRSQNISEECHLHSGEIIQSYCHGHSQLCCKVCITINHPACQTKEIKKLARNIQDSQELQHIIKKLNTLKNGFNDSLGKTRFNKSIILKNHSNAINEMMNLREEFDHLMAKTKFQAEKIKEEDCKNIEKVAATCDIVISQINKMTDNIETVKEKGATESLFVSMKHAESQLESLEETLKKLDQENTARQYKFEPDARLKALFNELENLGQIKAISRSDQLKKRLTFLKDITAKSWSEFNFTINGSLILPNKQILISDWDNKKLRLIDTNQNTIISELKLYQNPVGITKVEDNEVAVTIRSSPNKIQFVTLSRNSLSIGRNISVNGECRGIVYNDKDHTLTVAYWSPPKVEILNMEGTVIKCLDKDSKGDNLFSLPRYVALSPTMTEMFVTDEYKHSVINLTMNEGVKTEYKDESLQSPAGICSHSSGILYIVGWQSNTVHQLDPKSGELKLLLEQKDGLAYPVSISYCELEDKLYIGMYRNSILKVFQMK